MIDAHAAENEPSRVDATDDGIEKLIRDSGFQFGEFDPQKYGEAHAMSPRMVRFGIGLLLGLSQTKAHSLAGYTGEGSGARASASKLANGEKMRRFLKAANEARSQVPKGPLTREDKKQILAGISRSANEGNAIRAVLAHDQLDRDEQSEQSYEAIADRLRDFARRSAEHAIFADIVARHHDIEDFFVADLLPEAEREAYLSARAAITEILKSLPTASVERVVGVRVWTM